MFESSVLQTGRNGRPRGRALGVAVVAHGATLAAFLFAGVWSVEAVEPPRLPVEPYVKVLLPSPVGEERAAQPAAQQPVQQPEPETAAEPELVQPEVVPDEVPTETFDEPLPTAPYDPTLPAGGGSPDGVPHAPPGGGGSGGGDGQGGSDVPIHIDARVEPPRVIHRVQPLYTELARRMRKQGVVVVEAIIDRTGEVTAVRVLKPLGAGLDESAMAAVQQWRFAPAVMNDRPVPVYFKLTVYFHIQ